MLKYISSWIWKQNDEVLSLEEAYITLDEGLDEETNDKSKCLSVPEIIEDNLNQFETCIKTGKVTAINENLCKIDDKLTFEISDKDDDRIQVGSTVSYQLINSDGQFKVCDVAFVENDWNVLPQHTRKTTWATRTIVCTVTNRKGRMISLAPGDIKVNLNQVRSQFIPIVGDWVELEAKCEVDEQVVDLSGKILEITNITPLRTQIKCGRITRWNQNDATGVVLQNIFFNKDALFCGYLPVVGDSVSAEIIESNQGNCNWRAVKIIPDYFSCRNKNILVNIDDENFETEHEGITITDNITLSFTKLGEMKLFTIEIESKIAITMISIEIPRVNGQIKLVTDVERFKLNPGESLTLRLECKAKLIGEVRELIVFHFENFKIKRDIIVNVRDIERTMSQNNSSHKNKRKEFKPWDKREKISGGKLKMGARFQGATIPDYALPDRIKKIVFQYRDPNDRDVFKHELETLKPCLIATLTYMNYEDKFHTLLFLDEAHCIIEMSIYNQERACFIKSDEYLMLEIENLAEKRPSIILGDKILARNIYDAKSVDYEGYVHKTSKNHVYVKFSSLFHDSYNGDDYSIQIIASRTTYRREHHAIHLAVRNLGKEWLFPTQIIDKPPQIEFVFDKYVDTARDGEIIEVVSNDSSPKQTRTKDLILEKIRQFNENNREEVPPLKLEWYNQNLNFYQKEAVRNVLLGVCRPLPYLIFGPPGTGKTVTLVEVILQTLRMVPHSRILVAAPSNSAVDLMAIRLIDSGVVKPGDLIRLTSFTAVQNIPAKLAPYCATANLEKEGTQSSLPLMTPSGLVLGYSSAVIGRHRITVSTCSNAAVLFSMGFSRGHFSHIFIDEAGQTSESSVLIPLSFLDPTSGLAVMAGDPMQLGPVILSKTAANYGLEESLLERFINRFPYLRDIDGFPNSCGYDPRLITKLIYNYRSLPDILKLPSSLFYNDDLIPAINAEDSKEAKFLGKLSEILPQLKNGKPASLVFHSVDGENFQTDDSPSWYNPNEAAQVFYYINELYRLGCKAEDIGVITPYKAQTKQLLELFKEAEFDIPKVGTIEEFQGQESMIIILSTVRSSQKHVKNDLKYSLGFIASPRRLNVSLTRAKSLMMIVGNGDLLVEDRCWRSVINTCIEMGSYLGKPLTMSNSF